ncbi:glycerol-3-phosphate 1-O-acyltransferase PlsY [Fusobacterium perfoetens]|uniref:glycerol-3-phosphate 1-O-acyltransferase PlsY n=1 Tax=Fusobacterium perfoetens TaxID=852 RepID=UPI0015A2A2AF|nr:glycerol-3-phosphate 1-O-acyltransferase PlsY [Fusobacterium perfoetens]MCF2625176.1 glycerol-3-phosphate 1-O-acyltransferase PlsY [Fusobacterium perfoetens]
MSKYILLSLLAYFCGAIPSGVWIGKIFKGIDIRTVGSRNSGATNAYRILGAKCGIATLIMDALKGYLPLYIASHFNISDKYIVVLGLIAIFAHSMSCFLNFKGGKGVATSLGVFLFLAPKAVLVTFFGFLIVVYFTRYVSLSSITGAIILPVMVLILPAKEGVDKTTLVVLSFIIGAFVIYKHKSNIGRLLNGTESKITFGKKG